MSNNQRLLGNQDRLETVNQLNSDQPINVEPIKTNQIGISAAVSLFVSKTASDTVLASTINSITFTTNSPLVGDIISFTSGANSGLQIKVKSVLGQTAIIVNNFTSIPTSGDTFDILNYRYPITDDTGSITIAPLTNISVVKAQLQDNTGNGITSTTVDSKQALDVNTVTGINVNTSNIATVFSTSVSETSVQILASNTIRKGITIYNDSANSVYVSTQTPATSNTNLFAIVPSFSVFQFNYINYTGIIYAIRTAGNGAVVITEFT